MLDLLCMHAFIFSMLDLSLHIANYCTIANKWKAINCYDVSSKVQNVLCCF
jgi:hypothetical protein